MGECQQKCKRYLKDTSFETEATCGAICSSKSDIQLCQIMPDKFTTQACNLLVLGLKHDSQRLNEKLHNAIKQAPSQAKSFLKDLLDHK